MRIAALVKQIPAFEEMELGADGRLKREGLELEMNPYCRRAVSQAVELAAAIGDGLVTVFTLGPPTAEDVLREAIAWATENNVIAEGVLVTDPAFAGSDTLATARALAAAIEREGPFDLVLVGRNSVDADTGQVGPELAELLDLPFATGVRYLSLQKDSETRADVLHLRCEHDDGWVQAEVPLPAVVSTAERLIDPCKVDPAGRATVAAERIRTLHASDLGAGPWGQAGSPTVVGPVRHHEVHRARTILSGPVDQQVSDAVRLLNARGALAVPAEPALDAVPAPANGSGGAVAVIAEPSRPHETRELLGCAALLAAQIDGSVVALTTTSDDAPTLATWGADAVVVISGAGVEEDIARATAAWAARATPWAILVGSTAWGREVAARVAARSGAGLTGDAVALEVEQGRLVAWKPAFGGQLVAAVTSTSPVQMATVRAGVLPTLAPRATRPPVIEHVDAQPRGRVRVVARTRDDDIQVLAEASTVVGVGMGVGPAEYPALDPLLAALGAELGTTRKVTDKGWLPRARQIGITGRTIAPHLYVAIGIGGKFNHMVGVRASGTVLAINTNPDALVFDVADVGIIGDWREVLPLLVAELERVKEAAA